MCLPVDGEVLYLLAQGGKRMLNILDYITLRKDLSFAQCPFQEIDALIFSELAYIDWGGIAEEKIELPTACERFFQENTGSDFADKYAYSLHLPDLVRHLRDTNRYRHTEIFHYRTVFDEMQEIQFAAMTFRLEDGSLFIAYRGTDSTMIGWKEDMKMTYTDEVAAHYLAWNYALEIYDQHYMRKGFFGRKRPMNVPLYLGGHSKGGNLAMYVAFREERMQPAITKVYNFDGPGFRPSFYERVRIEPIIQRIQTYVPKDTIIGRLLDHKEAVIVVDAMEIGMSQHDAFHWSVEAGGFVTLNHWSEESDRVQQVIDQILMSKNDIQRKAYIDRIFQLLDRLEIKQLSDFSSLTLRQGVTGLREFTAMSSEERKFFFDVVNFLWTQSKDVFVHGPK